MKLRTLTAAKVAGRRVLVTAELNVARDARGRIVDDSRLRAVLPTLTWLRKRGARIVIATHLGRPNGRVVRSLSTRSLVRPLSRALRAPVKWIDESIGPSVVRMSHCLPPGGILLLENTRFHRGDELNQATYAKALSANADCFVLESFGTAHRRHASIVGVGKYLPAYAGLRLAEEVRQLSAVISRPARPFVAVVGGAKISTKLGLLAKLLPRVDALLLGGALANTILQAQGLQIGRSLTEASMLRKVRTLKLTNPKLHVPVDVVVRSRRGHVHVRAVGGVRPDESILDIGPDTVALFAAVLKTARTIVWNGPLGKYEEQPFDAGTKAIARFVARSRAHSLAGGGETVDAIRSQGLERSIDFLSTGGGAMLEFLEGTRLPGVDLVRTQ